MFFICLILGFLPACAAGSQAPAFVNAQLAPANACNQTWCMGQPGYVTWPPPRTSGHVFRSAE